MKKTRPRSPAPRSPARASFALHPLGLAALLAVAGPAAALPTGGNVVAGTATIQQPSSTLQVVTQGSQKAVIDWTSFSIRSGETVRFDQPSASAVLLNRVTGHDPSQIFGRMQSNGRIFLLNPYGVVFGSSARVDVGGLVASSLSLSTADFMAGRFHLTSGGDPAAPAQRGEVRNDGLISAPGGTVVLAGPVVANTGSIDAAGGRVGLAAVQEALVDVEGDGLVFFRTSGSEAGNRLAQLGRIQADGGSVELRAAARGAFADTVLNMSGIVQARSLGMREGRVVIDGGDAGITAVSGRIDASGTGGGERGGSVAVLGEKVLLAATAAVDASGAAGGGTVLVGGNWQGKGSEPNAAMTHVAQGASIDVRATGQGDGGTAVVWADDATRFHGRIDARGGADGGNGGQVEVSGKRWLDFRGEALISADAGLGGMLLLDPAAITIGSDPSSDDMSSTSPFETTSTTTSNLNVTTLVTVMNANANGVVRVNSGAGPGGSITLEAGADIAPTSNASLQFETDGAVSLHSAITLNGGSFSVVGAAGTPLSAAASFTSDANATIRTAPAAAGVAAGDVSIRTTGDISIGAAIDTSATVTANVTAGGNGGNIVLTTVGGGDITTAAGATLSSRGATAGQGGNTSTRLGGRAGDITIEADGSVDLGASVIATGGTGGAGASNGQGGGQGGQGGAIDIAAGGTLQVQAISANGGDGGNSANNANGGGGGNAGTVTLLAGQAVTLGGPVTATGGQGGAGDTNGSQGTSGNGGAGAAVSITSTGGAVVLGSTGSIATSGGAAGAVGQDMGTAGANAGITLSAGTDLNISATLNATAGAGAATIALESGQAGNGGTLTIDDLSRLSASAVTIAGGGTADDRFALTLSTGNSTVTLEDDELTLGGVAGLPSVTSFGGYGAATLAGSAGNNTIDVSGFDGTVTIHASTGTDTITGNGADTTLIGTDADSAWAITGQRAGTLNGSTSFSGIGRLIGGDGADTFTLGAGVTSFGGALEGGSGVNTLALTDGNNAITLTIPQGGALNGTTVFGNIDFIEGGSGTDTLTGLAGGANYSITGANALTVSGVNATSIEALVGGAGNDTFTLQAGVTSFGGSIDGGGGTDTLAVTDGGNSFSITGAGSGTLNTTTAFSQVANIAGGNGSDTFAFGAAGTLTGTVDGGGGANTLTLASKAGPLVISLQAGTITDNGANVVAGFESITGFTGNGTNTRLVGTNAAETFTLTGDMAGDVGSVSFAGMTSLDGGGGQDELQVASDVATMTLSNTALARSGMTTVTLSSFESATLTGGAGANAIDASAFTGNVSLLASAGSDSMIGNGATTTLFGTDNASTFTLSGAGAGTLVETGVPTNTTSFSGVGRLVGGAGTNQLVLPDGSNTVVLTGTRAGSVNAATLFLNMDALAGGSGDDTLIGPDAGTSYTITGANAVTVAGIAATSIEAVVAGSGNDSFTLAGGVTSFNGSLDGGGGNNTLSTTDGTNAFAISAANTGTLNGTTAFAHIGTLSGGSGSDSFTLASGVASFGGTIAGGGGNNTLSLTDGSNAIVLSGANAGTLNATTTFTGITALQGGSGSDTLTGPNAGSLYLISGAKTVSVAGISATSIDALTGGNGDDTFSFTAGATSFGGAIAGGGGNNTLSLTDGNNAITLSGANTGTLNGDTTFSGIGLISGGSGVDSLTGPAGGASYSITGSGTVVVSGVMATSIDVLNGSAGNDTFTLQGGITNFGGAINGGGGTDTLAVTNGNNDFVVLSSGAGVLNTLTLFSGIAHLTGGSGSDSFHFTAAGAVAGNVDGGGGTDTLSLAGKAGSQVFNLQAGSASANATPVVAGFSGIETLVGNGTATLVGTAANDTFTLIGDMSGTVNGSLSFSGISALNGGGGTDTLSVTADVPLIRLTNISIERTGFTTIGLTGFQAATLSGGPNINTIDASGFSGSVTMVASDGWWDTLIGNGANTTLRGSDMASNFVIEGADSGYVIYGGSASVWLGVGNLAGGSGNDVFTILNSGTLSGGIDGGGGTNTLDLSLKTTASIVLDQVSSTVTGVGVAGEIGNISTTIGNGANTTLLGNNTGQVFEITNDNEITVDGSKVFQGVGNLNAGNGADTIIGSAFTLAGSIVDAGGATTLIGAIRTQGGQDYAGPITAAAPLTLAANGNIVAANAANDFSTLSLTTGGSAGVTIVDANDISFGSVSLLGSGPNSISAGSSVNRTATLVASSAPTLTVGGVAVDNGLRNLFTTGAATSVQIQAGAGGTHDVTATGVSNLPAMTVSGNLTLSAPGSLNQSGALIVGGTTNITAGSDIYLLAAANDFQGAVSLAGGIALVIDANDLTLGTVATAALGVSAQGAVSLGQGSIAGELLAFSNGGTISQSGALTVAGASTIDAGSGSIVLTSANDFQAAVSLVGGTTSITDINALTLGTLSTGALTVSSGGALNLGQGSIGGNLTAVGSGPITQSGALSVDGAASISAGAGNITLTAANDFRGVVALSGATTQITDTNALTLGTLTTGSLVVNSVGALNLGQGSIAGNLLATSNGGAVTQSGPLTVTGTSQINAGTASITLTAANDFQGAVTLIGGATQLTDANALTLASLATGALSVTSSGALNLGQGSIGGALVANSNGGAITQAGALAVAGASQVNAGSGSITLTAANDFQSAVSLTGGTTQITDVNALTLGTLATGALTVTNTGALNLGQGSIGGTLAADSNGGAISQSGALTVSGASQINAGTGSITLTAANDFQSAVSLTGGTTQVVDANALTLGTATISAGQTFTATAGGTITLTGNVTTSADQRYVGNVALGTDVSLSAGPGRIDLGGTVNGAGHSLQLVSASAAADAIRIAGAVSGVDDLSVNGNATLGGNVTTSGNQLYSGPVVLATTTTLTGADITLQAGATGSGGLNVVSSGTTRVGGNISTTGDQHYTGAVLLTGSSGIHGASLRFDGTIDGNHALALSSAGGTTLNGTIGGVTALSSLSVTGPVTLASPTVRSNGAQVYGGTVALTGDTMLQGNGIAFSGTVDGAHALTIQDAGTTSLTGAIGGLTPLTAFTVTGGVQAGGDVAITAGAVSLGGGIAGADDLVLRTDSLSIGGPLAGTGTLAIEPLSAGLSLGIAGGSGDLQISQATIDGANGFAAHRFGRADGTGSIDVGTLRLAADTTLATGSGNLTLGGSVDGAFDLTLASGGTTTLRGAIGTTTALRSLTTDKNAAAADWDGASGERTVIDVAGGARIVTTGAQTYHDPLVTTGPVRFEAGTVTATHAANRIDGRVEAVATQLDLRSTTALVLGDVTLAGGGWIETDQTVEIDGTLRLDGGTLAIVANGTPTALPDFTDPELAGQGGTLNNGAREASATIFESSNGTVSTAAGSLLALRATQGGSIALDNESNGLRNDMRGRISAVSGTPGTDETTSTLGFVRIASTEINVAGAPQPGGSSLEGGIEGDVLKLSADKITTGATGQLRARLPFDNFLQGANNSIPGLTLVMSPTALTIGGGFGLSTPDGYIRVRIGNESGGYLTVRPRGATGEHAFILLAGPDPRPFYDLNGRSGEVRVFYNGDAPRTPQETGALSALMAIVEDARQTRFEEAVRTENVKTRLRSGVIAEVGSGRPATVGRESIRPPVSCNPKDTTLQCE